MDWKYSKDKKSIVLDNEPSRFKYLTGTRFASALGLNPYSTPFQIWCECTRLVTPPFEETVYIKAGRVIEPLQREYVSKTFPNIMSPEEYFGNIFEQVRWNFFDEKEKPFAGCWDAVATKENGKDINMVVEFKTASDPRKWSNNTVPVYYALQGALYAKLLNLDRVLFVASFPSKLDYAHPEDFVPNEENTIMIVKKLKDMIFELDGAFYTVDDLFEKAKEFWNKYVITGISPEFDEKLDKEYLDIIRESKPINDNSLEDLCDKAGELIRSIEKLKEDSGINAMEKELKTIEASIKEGLMNSLEDGETSASCKQYKLSGTVKEVFDEKAFATKHPKTYAEYLEAKITYRLSKSKGE